MILRKCYQCRLIPLAFIALVLENELQYHGLAVRINSGDDSATLCKKFVEHLSGNSRDDRAYLRTYVFVLKENRPKPAFVVLPFRNATEYCYADGRINSSNDQADINLVGF